MVSEWYCIIRDGKFLSRKSTKSVTDSIGLSWSTDIQTAIRFSAEWKATKTALRINGSTKVRKVNGLKLAI